MKQIDIKNNFGYNVYEKYKNMVKGIVGKEFKKRANSNITFVELENQAWIAIMTAHDSFDNTKETDVETYIYNNIIFNLKTFLRANMYTVKVSHCEITNKIAGYNKILYKKVKDIYDVKLEKGLITLEKYEQILEDTKKELKTTNIVENKECNFNYNDIEIENNDKDSFNSFDSYATTKDETKRIEQKDLIKKILMLAFDKKIINKNDLDILQDYYVNAEKKAGFQNIILKFRKLLKENSKFDEDMKDIIKDMTTDN